MFLHLVNGVGIQQSSWQLTGESDDHKTQLNLSNFAEGVYLLQAEAGKQKATKRVVKIE